MGGPARQAEALPAGYTVNGLDVYYGNGTIDWNAAYNAGARFGWAKATEGLSFVDPKYAANHSGALAAGVKLGAYHFGRPDKGNPVAQANFFIDRAQYTADGNNLPPQLDIEGGAAVGQPYCYGLSPSALVSWIRAFVDQVKARTGRDAVIYTGYYFWKDCTGNDSSFGANPLEIARYGSTPGLMPASWSKPTAWQYDCAHTFPGAPSNNRVCQTAFNGSLSDLNEFAGGGSGGGRTQFADIDGNGRDEIVDVRDNGDVVAFLNLNGDWASGLPIYDGGYSKVVASGGFRPSQTRFADLDGDGRDEIIDVRANGDVVAFRNMNGDWWSPWPPVYDGGSSKLVAQGFLPSQTRFADLDDDRRAEIIDVRANGDVVAFRNLSGSWADSSRMYDGGASKLVAQGFPPSQTRFADLDGDRRDEIVDVRANGDVWAFRNLSGSWADSSRMYDGGVSKLVAQGFRPTSTRFADLDNEDWRQEIVDVRNNGDVWAFRNLSGSWAGSSRMYDGGNSRLVASGGFRP